MPTITELESWTGIDVVGPDGERIGRLDHAYVDRETGEPTFLALQAGFLDLGSALVPARGAHRTEDDAIAVEFDTAAVKAAPHVKAGEELTAEEETRLFEHYGLGGAGHASVAGAGPVTHEIPEDQAERERLGVSEAPPPAAGTTHVHGRLRRHVLAQRHGG